MRIIPEETLYYQNYFENSYRADRLFLELLSNAYRTISSVYLFKNFNEYCRQLWSNRQEDKLEIFWNVSYYEKLIDYIKITVAFENYNKAALLKNGIVIHQIDPSFNRGLSNKQRNGDPVTIEEFMQGNFSHIDFFHDEAQINGLRKNFPTISFSHTLKENYQKVIGLDSRLVSELKKINANRNKLHFFTDFKGAFSVSHHIEKWEYIKEKSLNTIEAAFKAANENLKISSSTM